jgi:hypothetical protein
LRAWRDRGSRDDLLATGAFTVDASFEWTVLSWLVGQWFSVDSVDSVGSVGFRCGLGARSTLRRRPQSMRRISTVSVERGSHTRLGSRPASVANWSWYSSSVVDLMLISRKRADSFELVEPHPSTMLKAIDSAALVIWDLSEPRSLRGNFRIPLRTPRTSPCALSQTSSRRKSCMREFSPAVRPVRRRFSPHPRESLRRHPLTTTDELTNSTLPTQDLHPLRQISNSAPHDSARMQ